VISEPEPEILLGSDWNGLSNVLEILTDEPLTSEDGTTYGTLNVKTAWKKFGGVDGLLKMGFWWDFTPSESYAAVEYDSTMAFAFAVDDVEEESSVAVFTSDEIGVDGGTFHKYRYKQNIEKSLDTMTASPIGPSETDDLADAKLFPFLWQNGAEEFFVSYD